MGFYGRFWHTITNFPPIMTVLSSFHFLPEGGAKIENQWQGSF